VFFDTLGIKWWYEPEGFSLRFDYEAYAAEMVAFLKLLYKKPELYEKWGLQAEERMARQLRHLDGKEYSYLPDFYLPELNYWIEVKGPNPTRAEIEKAFMLERMAQDAGLEIIREARTEAEKRRVSNDVERLGVFIIYGDIPWPFPEKGNIFGFEELDSSRSSFPWTSLVVELGTDEPARKPPEYRGLLTGQIKLCWKECPLCLRIGVGTLGEPYCRSCQGQIAQHIWDHLASYKVISEAGTQDTSDHFAPDKVTSLRTKLQNPANAKAVELTKGLMNPEFFTSGHKSPRLREAYSAARSARFEHGQSP
jgi:hypothetical protein